MPELSKILSKGRAGIVFFFFIFVFGVVFSIINLNGNELILNVLIRGVFALTSLFCVYFLIEHPTKALTISLVICGYDSLMFICQNLFDVLKYGGIREFIPLILGGGLRLLALWVIWTALSGVKSILKAKYSDTG